MVTFSCPDHGRLVVLLALGRLDDREAVRAEEALQRCAQCGSWWTTNLEPAASAALDAAVAEGLAGFRAPRRGVRRWWMTAAAAAVVAIGATSLWWRQPAPTTVDSGKPAAADALLTCWTFEDGSLEVAEIVAAPAPPARAEARPAAAPPAPAPLQEGGFESGDLSGWTSHT